jgi:hypothetical protein
MAKGKSIKAGLPSNEENSEPNRPKNALVHGFYAEDVLLPWESSGDFDNLVAELQEEFQPNGRMEREVILDLAHLRWQKQRLRKMWHAAAHRDPFVGGLVASANQSLQEIRDHLQTQTNEIHSSTAAARSSVMQFSAYLIKLFGDLQKDLQDELELKARRKNIVPTNLKKFNDIIAKIRAEEKLRAEGNLKENQTKAAEALANEQQDESEIKEDQTDNPIDPDELEKRQCRIQQRIDGLGQLTTKGLTLLIKTLETAEMTLSRAYLPEYLEPVIRIEALIDARIDKLLGRLVSLKEYKRIEATRKPVLIPENP